MIRNPRFNAFVGSPGSGKTTYINKLLKKVKSNIIVLKLWYNIDDVATLWLPLLTLEQIERRIKNNSLIQCRIGLNKKDYKPILEFINSKFRNGILIIDDATIFEKDKLSVWLEDMLVMRRHLGLDIWLVYHGFTGFPIDQYKYLNYLMVFNTVDNPNYKKNKIPQYELINNAIEQSKKTFAKYSYSDPRRYTPTIVKLSE